MVKKILRTALKILIIILAYLLQIYIVNNVKFFGVNGDLCLMAVVLITLIERKHVAYIAAIICGVASDVLFSTVVCRYLSIYVIVVSILIGLKKMYKSDSKLAIIIFSVAGVIASEILMFLFNVVETGKFVNIFIFILNILKQCIINICFAFLIYMGLKICSKEGE